MLYKGSKNILIKKGVRQSDNISPKLFTAVLEEVYEKLKWEDRT